MKKLFVLFAACMIVFACGSSNKGVDYIKNAQEALEAGDLDLAQEHMAQYYDWCKTASQEEIDESLVELQSMYSDMVKDFYKGMSEDFSGSVDELVNGLGIFTEDYTKAIEKVSDEYNKAIEEVAEEYGKAIEGASEEITKALEESSEEIEDAVNAATKEVENAFKNLF